MKFQDFSAAGFKVYLSFLIALRLYGAVDNLRVLVGGGDGSINWVLRAVEHVFEAGTSPGLMRLPPVAPVPLGTGNDLSRELGWGSAYHSRLNLQRVLLDIEHGPVVNIDIWRLWTEEKVIGSKKAMPTSKFNNYFSLGSDAATALEFHRSRERSPQRFSSRLKNKLCYAELGGKDIVRREYKNLVDYVSLKCDGVCYDTFLSQIRPHCIVVLNISNYCSGTNPWGRPGSSAGFQPQSPSDGVVEVIGLSAASLATLHMGGQGDRIAQCSTVEINIRQQVPIQIDGEPSLLIPSTLRIEFDHAHPFVRRSHRSMNPTSTLETAD